jgi:hypothetical protein
MEGILTQIKDPNIVPETVTSRSAYLATPQPKIQPPLKNCSKIKVKT